ncbi:hypothetical protein CR513_25362, partial [Mucuna pruriens]
MVAELVLRWPLRWIADVVNTVGPLFIGLHGLQGVNCRDDSSLAETESLAPTLEEYERIIGLPLAKSPPYLFRGQYPSWALVAKLLQTSKSEVLGKKGTQNDLEGIQKANIEDRLYQLQQEGDWRTFMDVYGLLIYGIVPFPHVEDYIDLVAVDAFLTKKDKGENPVIVVLANTYYTLNYCHEKNGKGLRCCTSLLYLWITTHLFHNKRRATCPIEDHHWSWVKPMSRVE